MRIRRLRVDGFGNLKGDFIFSSDRCNLILEPNESGKSTLAAAVLAALYGFPRERASRDRPIKLKEQYRPWSGGPYAIEMDLECRDRAYTVRRDFDRDTAAVLDGQTGRDITAEFSRGKDQLDFGESLTGLTREDFIRCGFVGQKEVEALRDASGLTHALQRIASSQQGDVVAGEAIEAIEHALDRDYVGMLLGRGKVDTEVKRLDKEIDDLRAQMERITDRRRDSEEKIRRLEEAADREGQVELTISRVDYLCLLAGHREVEAALQQRAREQEEVQAYRDEVKSLAAYADFPAEKLGELREMKGRIDSLEDRRSAFEQRLKEQSETPLQRAEQALAGAGSLETLDETDAKLAADRLAVVNDLWDLRREKRRALRLEHRRLAKAGIDPGHAAELATRLSGLSQEDRAYLETYREKLLELRATLSEAARERDKLSQAEGGDSPALVSLAAARRSETIALVVGVAGLALSTVLWLSLATVVPALACILVALFALAYWAILLERRPVHGAEEFGTTLQRLQTEIWTREKEQAALQERVLTIAGRVGYKKPDRLVEDYRELEGLQEMAAPLSTLAASVQEVQTRYSSAAGDLLDLMNRAGCPPRSRLITPRLARRFRLTLDRHLEDRQKLSALRTEVEAGRKELAGIVRELAAIRDSARSLLGAALGPDRVREDLAEALALFEEGASRKDRLVHLTRELLPSAERRSQQTAESRMENLTREREVLAKQIARATAGNPSLTELSPEKSSREYAEQRRQLQEEARRTQKDRLALSEELGDVLKEYRRDYPTRQEMLARLESARARAVAFRDAAGIAREVLSGISREAYAEWAEVLNDKTSETLRRMNPNYEDVRFDTDLSFTLRDTRSGRRLDQNAVEAHFSAGARDQVYLAVRMAAAEYLSAAGVRLPLILDDPFASFDDERFERAMEFLLETLGRRHQIILLSCHAARHRTWQDGAPEALADRVRVLDLTPLST
ncbi:MAG TPA: AAA family ATPase [Patescibacteria group bacterium]|nr:AAA family ATPase [Patescibacteria group bacterium]